MSKKQGPPIRLGTVSKWIEAQARHLDGAIYGGDGSFARNPLPETFEADDSAEPVSIRPMLPQVARLAQGGLGSLYYFKRRVYSAETNAPSTLFPELEQFAIECGASAIGYAKITPDLLFKGEYIPYNNAIIIVSEMRQEMMKNAPSYDSMTEIGKAYADTSITANKMAGFLRRLGYGAYAGVSLGGSADHVRLAENAALGAIGYHGSLISPQDGARLRINVVYTSIENLPYPTENEHLWVRDFCDKCRKCIRKCPPQAIYSDPEPDENGRVAAIDYNKCGPYMANNKGCGVCIAICPFSVAGYDKIQKGFLKRQQQSS